MEIIESWEDQKRNVYAIVRYSNEERQEFNNKEYEAMWMGEVEENKPELNSFGGSVGFRIAEFDTMEEAQDFLLQGITEEGANRDVWWDMLAV